MNKRPLVQDCNYGAEEGVARCQWATSCSKWSLLCRQKMVRTERNAVIFGAREREREMLVPEFRHQLGEN